MLPAAAAAAQPCSRRAHEPRLGGGGGRRRGCGCSGGCRWLAAAAAGLAAHVSWVAGHIHVHNHALSKALFQLQALLQHLTSRQAAQRHHPASLIEQPGIPARLRDKAVQPLAVLGLLVAVAGERGTEAAGRRRHIAAAPPAGGDGRLAVLQHFFLAAARRLFNCQPRKR